MSKLPEEFKNASLIWTKDEKATYCRRSDFDTTREKNFRVVTFKKTFDFTIYCGIINNKTIFRGVVCLTNYLL